MPIDVTEPTQTSVMNTPRIEGGLFDNANAVGTVFNPAVQSDYRLNHGAVKTSTMRAKAFDNSVSRSRGAFQTLVFAGDHPDPLLAIRAEVFELKQSTSDDAHIFSAPCLLYTSPSPRD